MGFSSDLIFKWAQINDQKVQIIKIYNLKKIVLEYSLSWWTFFPPPKEVPRCFGTDTIFPSRSDFQLININDKHPEREEVNIFCAMNKFWNLGEEDFN